MELKTSVAEHLTSTRKRKALIAAITAIVMTVCLAAMFSSCTPPQETRQLIIPSELEPEVILPDFGGEIFYGCFYEAGKEPGPEVDSRTITCVSYIQDFVEGWLEKDFIKGYLRAYSIYTLENGKEIGIAFPLIQIFVLKYESSEAAEQAFNIFTEVIELKDAVIDGAKIKWQHNPNEPAVYMLQSNNFIIYIDGSVEPCKDAVSRIIGLYSAPLNKNN